MKKWIGRIAIVVVILLVAAVVVVNNSAGRIVKAGIEKAAPKALGVPVTLGAADLQLLRGQARLNELVIGNPAGYRTESLLRMGELSVGLDTGSLFGDKVIVDRILIDGPEVTYELGMGNSNIGTLLKNLQSDKPAGEAAGGAEPAQEPTDKSGGKQVVIRELLVRNGKVRVSAKFLRGQAVVLPLPPIRLTDIGEKQGGASMAETVGVVVGAISQAAVQAVASSGKLLGKTGQIAADAALAGVGAAAGLAGDTLKQAGDLAGKGVGALTNLTGAAAGVVGAGAGAAGETLGGATESVSKGAGAAAKTATEGVGAAAGAAGKGVEAATRGVGAVGRTATQGLGAAAGTAGKGVGAAAKGVGSAADAAGKAGTAVGRSASKLVGGVTGGLFGKKKDKPDAEAEEAGEEEEQTGAGDPSAK